jgi:hypothetical protein
LLFKLCINYKFASSLKSIKVYPIYISTIELLITIEFSNCLIELDWYVMSLRDNIRRLKQLSIPYERQSIENLFKWFFPKSSSVNFTLLLFLLSKIR